MVESAMFWSLPGPQDFRAEIASLLAGFDWRQQLIVAVPDRGRPPGLIEVIVKLPTCRAVLPVAVSAGAGDVLATVLTAAGSVLPDRVPTLGDVLQAPELQGRLLLVDAQSADATQVAQVLRLCDVAAQAVHNLLELAVDDDASLPLQVAAVVPGRFAARWEDGPRLAVRWWFGRVTDVDLTVLLRRSSAGLGRIHDPATLAAVCRVAKYDLDLAVRLSESWDGDAISLPTVVRRYVDDSQWPREHEPKDLPGAGDRPTVDILDAWADGACDVTPDGSVAWHSGLLSDSQLLMVLWQAQVATIMPMIEDQRARLLDWIDRRGHRDELRRSAKNDPPEISDVRHYMKHRAGMGAMEQMKLATWLWNARNDLAHRRYLSRDRLEDGARLIADVAL